MALLGWYEVTTKDEPNTRQDLAIYKNISKYCENPLCLLLNPETEMIKANKLPLKLFNFNSNKYTQVPYNVDPSKAEGISIDYLTKNIENTHSSKFFDNMTSTASSFKIFNEKIVKILGLLEDQEKIKLMMRNGSLQQLKEALNNFPI